MRNTFKKSLALIISLIIVASVATVPASAVNVYEENRFMGLIEIYDYGNEEEKNFFQKITDTFHWYIARLFIYFDADCPICKEHFGMPAVGDAEEYYNKAINDLKDYKGEVTIVKTKTVKIEVSENTVEAVKSIVDSLAEYMSGTTKTTYVFKNGVDSEGRKISDVIQPVGRYAQLTRNGVVSSTVYTSSYAEKINAVTIGLISETSIFDGTVITNPAYNSTVIEPINPATLEIEPLSIREAKLTYPETVVNAVFDDEGRAQSIKIHIPVDSVFAGKVSVIAFSANCYADITEQYTVTYG